MFEILVKKASVALRGPEEVESIISGLSVTHSYKPVVRSMISAGFQTAGGSFDPAKMQEILTGRYRSSDEYSAELFFGETEVYLLNVVSSELVVWAVRPHAEISQIHQFCDNLTSVARAAIDGRRLRGMDFTWLDIAPQLPRARQIGRHDEDLTSVEPEYSAPEARQAEALQSNERRKLLIRLAQMRGRALSSDASDDVGNDAIQPLLELGLVGKEYLVVCRQDSHTICIVRETAHLTGESTAHMRCTVCGRPFSDELVREVLAITDAGSRLLSGSRWMTIWVTELLRSAGLRVDQIKWGASSGDDEIDVIANIFGTKLFFELKDRDFGMGDAYPFLYRVERYGGSQGVVLSTSRVAEEVKNVFNEQPRGGRGVRRVPMETMEGVEFIAKNLPNLVEGFSQKAVISLMEYFTDELGLNLAPIVQTWMNQTTRDLRRRGRLGAQSVEVTTN